MLQTATVDIAKSRLTELVYARPWLLVCLVCVSLALLVSLSLNLYLAYLAGAMRYVTVSPGVHVSRPGEVPPDVLKELSLRIMGRLGNVNADGLPGAIEDVKAFMTPQFRQDFEAVMALQSEAMEDADITMSLQKFELSRIDSRWAGGTKVYTTWMHAERILHVGDLAFPAEQVEVMIEYFPVTNPQANLYGLWINNMHWPSLLDAPAVIKHFAESQRKRRSTRRSVNQRVR